MWSVNLALVPLTIQAVINFGLPALITILVSITSALITEFIIQIFRRKKISINDGSPFLTGLLLALCLPPNIPWFMTMLGSIAAIGIAKQMFGGLGHNIFNPALIGRAFIMACFPVAMTTWGLSILTGGHETITFGFLKLPTLHNLIHVDAITSATPLGIVKLQGYNKLIELYGSKIALYKNLFFGYRTAGCIGETSALFAIIGGIYLSIKNLIKWQVPVVMIGTVGLLSWIFAGKESLFSGDPIFYMLSGGLIFGAFFMATDMVTTPMTLTGKIIFAIGCAIITFLIRLYGGYPEGVCYSILLMNALTPLIDKFIVPKKFGSIKTLRTGSSDVEIIE